jgi:hypothetical protein
MLREVLNQIKRKGESKMLFMKIVHIDPEKKPEVTKKRISAGIPKLPGVKIIGEWSTLDSSRVFLVLDVTDPRDLVKMVAPYQHMVRDEIFPVMDTEEKLKLVSALEK